MRFPARLLWLAAVVPLAFCLGCDDQSSADAQLPPGDAPPATETASATDAASTSSNDAEPAPAPTATTARSSRSGGIKDITFDTIKFDLEVGERHLYDRKLLSSEITDLNGRRVRIRGYMLPSFQQSGLKQFILVRDNLECCFGPEAALYDCIAIDMMEGKTTDFSVRPVTVEGTFSLHEQYDFDGQIMSVYHIWADSVR